MLLNAQTQSYTVSDTLFAKALIKESADLNAAWKCDTAFLKADSAEFILFQIFKKETLFTADALQQKGRSKFCSSKFDESIAFYEKALTVEKAILGDNHSYTAALYNDFGRSYTAKRSFDQAIYYFQKSLSILLKSVGKVHLSVAWCYHNLGINYYTKAEYDKAIENHLKALDIRLQLLGTNHYDVAESYSSLGAFYSRKGDFDKAIESAKKGLTIRLKILGPSTLEVASSYNNLGSFYQSKGDYGKAIEYNNEALAIRIKKLGAKDATVAAALINLGNCYNLQGQYDEAISVHQKSLDINIPTFGEKHSRVLQNYKGLGAAFLGKKDFEHSLSFMEKASDISLKIFGNNTLEVAAAYENLGEFYYQKTDYNQSFDFHKKAMDIRTSILGRQHPDISLSYRNMGSAALKLNRFHQVDTFFQNALSNLNYQSNDLSKTNSMVNLLNTLYYKALFELDWYLKTQDSVHLNQSVNTFEEALAAIAYQNKTLTTEGSKVELKKQTFDIYGGAIKTALLASNRYKNEELKRQTFICNELSKASQLQAQIKESAALQFANIPNDLLQKENDLRIDISWHDKQRQEKINAGKNETDSLVLDISSKLFDLRQQYDSLKTFFEKNYPDYYRLKYDLATTPLSIIQQKMLSPNQTLLSYFVGDSAIYAFVVRKDTFAVVDIKKDFPLEAWVRQLRDGLYGYHTADVHLKTEKLYDMKADSFVDAASKLYAKIIGPLSKMLTQELVIVPDGALGYVPFDVLLSEKPQKNTNFSTYSYFGKEKIISYNYSATLWQEMQDKKHKTEAGKNFMAYAPYFQGDTSQFKLQFADDLAARKDLDSLKYTGEEVYKAQKLMHGASIIGKEATKDKFIQTAHNYRIVHLATHGKANDKMGDYSYLAFTELKDSLDNELLYVRDIYNLSLNADMVVLSACETGIGELKRGEGIISLARAFAFAGAKSMLTSLWSVNDKSTMLIMERFYRHLKSGQTKDKALWQAKLDYIDKSKHPYTHPYYWSGIIPIGDMRKIKN